MVAGLAGLAAVLPLIDWLGTDSAWLGCFDSSAQLLCIVPATTISARRNQGEEKDLRDTSASLTDNFSCLYSVNLLPIVGPNPIPLLVRQGCCAVLCVFSCSPKSCALQVYALLCAALCSAAPAHKYSFK